MRLARPVAGAAAVVAVAALVGAPTAAPGAPAQAEAPASYSFVSASSGGDGIRIFFDIVGFLPIAPALSLSTVSAEGFVESTRRTAVALLPDPGSALVGVPGLVAGLLGVPNIPAYPLVARADDPFVPVAEASPVAGTGVGVIRAEASADRAAATARLAGLGTGTGLAALEPVTALLGSLLDGLGLPDLGGPLLDLGVAEVTVEETQTSPTQLTATATTSLSGISLLGGLVRVASIETTASAALDGAVATAEPPTVEVAGVTVAGIPARITERGLELAGSASPLGALLAPLVNPLLNQGIGIKLAPSEASVEGTTARARGGGLVIEATSAFQGYPVILRVTIGEARAVVQASGPRTAGDDGGSAGNGGGGGASSPGTTVRPAGTGGTVPTTRPSPSTATSSVAAPVLPDPGVGVGPSTPVSSTVPELFDFRSAYGGLVVLALALGGSRFLGASRLRRRPGSRPEVKELFRW